MRALLGVEVDLLREPSEAEKAALERAIAEARQEIFRWVVEGNLYGVAPGASRGVGSAAALTGAGGEAT